MGDDRDEPKVILEFRGNGWSDKNTQKHGVSFDEMNSKD